jgi:hypothetical protein
LQVPTPLLFIYAAPAAGKLAVAREIAELTGSGTRGSPQL